MVASVGVNVYGTNASNAVAAIGGFVGAGGSISGSAMTAIAQAACDERTRRGGSLITIPNGYYSGTISAARLDMIKTVLEIPGPAATQAYNTSGTITLTTYPQVAATSNATSFAALVGSTISATHINSLITEINSAKAACTCNCNYCTCNCNYCTCNCNYSCTCNCNYSDEQLKTNIEYI